MRAEELDEETHVFRQRGLELDGLFRDRVREAGQVVEPIPKPLSG
jgi:hypothetical protein